MFGSATTWNPSLADGLVDGSTGAQSELREETN
jgi:hypothetical protein